LIAPSREEMPVRWMRKIQASCPALGEYWMLESGG
jgi:hypothetical protein